MGSMPAFGAKPQQPKKPAPAPAPAPVQQAAPSDPYAGNPVGYWASLLPQVPVQPPPPPPPPAAPAVATQPAATTVQQLAAPTRTTAQNDVDAGIAHGRTVTDDLLKGVTMGKVTDSYKTDVDAVLEQLKARLGGLDSKEMLAAKEQGITSLGQRTAQNLERYASIAGAQGVRGGAAAALQRRALTEDNQGRAGLERQLILDNITAKDRAMGNYLGALTNQQRVGLDISKQHVDADDRMTGLRLDMPFKVSGLVDAADAANWSNYFGEKGIDTANRAIASTTPAPRDAASDARQATTTAIEEWKAEYKNGSMRKNGQPLNADEAMKDPRIAFAHSKGYRGWLNMPNDLRNSPEAIEALGQSLDQGYGPSNAF